MKLVPAFVLAALLVSPAGAAPDSLDQQARQFVQVALNLGGIDIGAVDAYFGPKPAPLAHKPSLDALKGQLSQLAAAIQRDPPSPRRDRLLHKTQSLSAVVDVMKSPHALSFDQEALRLYGVTALPPPDPQKQDRAKAALARLLPGRGEPSTRLINWRYKFSIPEDRRAAVFERALAECRARTRAHWKLPPDEGINIIWDRRAPAASHRYEGHDRSMLTINPAAVSDPGTALDVACHEAYPGHHAQFLAMATRPGGIAIEDSVVVLHSPEQVLREGAANYGVDLAFSPADRLAFTRDVLFPLAGFKRSDAAQFEQVHRLIGELALSVLPTLRAFYDGKLASGDAAAALFSNAMVSSPMELEQFTKENGAYVIGYTQARDLVRDCVAKRARATKQDPWTVLYAIVAEPDVTVLDHC